MRTIQRDIVGGFIFSKDGKVLLGKANVAVSTLKILGKIGFVSR
jgi:hypothetical protein